MTHEDLLSPRDWVILVTTSTVSSGGGLYLKRDLSKSIYGNLPTDYSLWTFLIMKEAWLRIVHFSNSPCVRGLAVAYRWSTTVHFTKPKVFTLGQQFIAKMSLVYRALGLSRMLQPYGWYSTPTFCHNKSFKRSRNHKVVCGSKWSLSILEGFLACCERSAFT